jgi:hypothetical protein
MIGLLGFALAVLAGPFKSKMRLEAENAVLRQQLIVLRRRLHGRVRLTNCAFRRRRPRYPAHGDHVIRSMTTRAAHEFDGAVGFIF